MNKLLIVIDMQNDFLLPDGKLYIGRDMTDYISRCVKFIKEFDGEVIYTQDIHNSWDQELTRFPMHCMEATDGSELVEELPLKGRIFRKNVFADSGVISYNQLLRSREIHFIGVCTHICVHDNISLIANYLGSFNLESGPTKLILHRDLVEDFDKEMEDFAIKRLRNLYGVEIREQSE